MEEHVLIKASKAFLPQMAGGAIGAIIAITILQVRYEFLANTLSSIKADYIPREVYNTEIKNIDTNISAIKDDIKSIQEDVKTILLRIK